MFLPSSRVWSFGVGVGRSQCLWAGRVHAVFKRVDTVVVTGTGVARLDSVLRHTAEAAGSRWELVVAAAGSTAVEGGLDSELGSTQAAHSQLVARLADKLDRA